MAPDITRRPSPRAKRDSFIGMPGALGLSPYERITGAASL